MFKPTCLLTLVLALLIGGTGANAAVPKRIVSILPSATEVLYALGLADRIVADTTNCDYPPAAKAKPHIGDMNVNIEAIIALKPDLVVGDSDWNSRDVARLRQLHIDVFAPHPTSMRDVENELIFLGQLTGTTARAKVIVNTMQARERLAARMAKQNHRRPKVLEIAGHDPLYVSGQDTFIGQMVNLAGGINVVTAQGFPNWSKETAIASMPDLILCGADTARQIAADPAWRIVPAVREHHISTIPSDLIERPGPRLADGLLQVARLIHEVAK
ncbi:MAG TPA: helical backbone metal receptor [Capsulimonadaceae bacterium]|nr:helical backbone metal receptor [Capsulimonadaceae bacterium]